MIDTEKNIEEVYSRLLKIIDDLMSDYDPLLIAGCMMAQSLAIYRTTLPEEDYIKLIDAIAERKDQVKTFIGRQLH